MIYCFSGTGNSRFVAERLARRLGDTVHTIGWDEIPSQPAEEGGEIGFVFPVYGWRMPRVVERFVRRLPRLNAEQHHYIYAVLTCGDDIGRTHDVLRRELSRRGWPLHAVFSVNLRNTYVCLPGFDVDSAEVEQKKQFQTADAIDRRIVPIISKHGASTPADVCPGTCAWLKTYVLGPLFHQFLTSDAHFRSVSALCTRCGVCAKVCPLDNISLSAEGNPQWHHRCTHCLACYHFCPRHAISYGRFSRGKGQVKRISPQI